MKCSALLKAGGAEFIEDGVRRRKRSPEEIEARVQAIAENRGGMR